MISDRGKKLIKIFFESSQVFAKHSSAAVSKSNFLFPNGISSIANSVIMEETQKYARIRLCIDLVYGAWCLDLSYEIT